MAKKESSASRTVASAMRRRKSGTLKSSSGQRVRSRKQAIAIGLSEARSQGRRCPRGPGRAQPRRAVADVVVPPVDVRSVCLRSVTVAQVGVAPIGETLEHGLAPHRPR